MGRLDAALKRCRTNGGDCPCPAGQCEALGLLQTERRELTRRLETVDKKIAWLEHIPCTVKAGWVMPPKPDGDYFAAVINDDGWHPHWYSETEECDYVEITGEAAWPFVEETAYADDWVRLGFEII